MKTTNETINAHDNDNFKYDVHAYHVTIKSLMIELVARIDAHAQHNTNCIIVELVTIRDACEKYARNTNNV